MYIQVAKWGDSPALRIPKEYVRSMGINGGERMEAALVVEIYAATSMSNFLFMPVQGERTNLDG